MQLLANTTSPFVRIARIAMIEKGLEIEPTIVDPWADDARLRAANAATRVPTLILDDGTPLGLRRRRTMVEGIARLEAIARRTPLWTKGAPTLDAFTAVVAVDYLRFRFADAAWMPPLPTLDAMSVALLRERPSVAKTLPR
jgi:glutathione S-transferase